MVCRLTKPWFYSGRTIIADALFGRPEMVRSMKSYGLYSIMKLKKTSSWPRGMPKSSILDNLSTNFGDYYCLKSTLDDLFLILIRDISPQILISDCSVVVRSSIETERYIDHENE